MELGPLEGSYLELLNSSADPLQLYHLYDRMDLTGEEEIELCSGGLPSLGPLSRPSAPLSPQWRYHPGDVLAVELHSAPRTAPTAGQASSWWGPLPARHASPSFPSSLLPRSFQLYPSVFSSQSLTQTPSTANSSAGCCVTWKVMKRPGKLMPISVRKHS